MSNYTDKHKINIPEGTSGNWRVEKFTVSEEDAKFESIRAVFKGGRGVPEGEYTALRRNGATVMSDTPDEIRDHITPIRWAKGNVLINGLGLGVVLQGVLNNPDVEHATVIEISPDVIELVGKHYKDRYGERLTIIQADALEYKPPKGQRFDVVWHDIWDNICTDNLPEMHKLHRKYGRRTDWQGSWCRETCEWRKRQERKQERGWY